MKMHDKSRADPVKRKKQPPVPAETARISITDCTEEEMGLGFIIIGVGGNAPSQQPEPVRVTDLPAIL
jgi:hypothetical protein